MELKGIEKINDFLTDWLLHHDFDIVAEMGKEFCVDLNSNTLYYAPYAPDDLDEIFLEEIVKEFPECEAWTKEIIPYVSFFHEVGHVETEDNWTSKDFKKFTTWKEKLQEKIDKATDPIVRKEEIVKYYHHPIEWAATTWAIDYIINHTKTVQKFADEWATLLQEFYSLNQVELG